MGKYMAAEVPTRIRDTGCTEIEAQKKFNLREGILYVLACVSEIRSYR